MIWLRKTVTGCILVRITDFVDEERLDKLDTKEEEATATLQIVEINLNKLEPRAGSMEKRLASIEQDISSKVKPRFNVLDAKIADLQKKFKDGAEGAGDTGDSGASSACKFETKIRNCTAEARISRND